MIMGMLYAPDKPTDRFSLTPDYDRLMAEFAEAHPDPRFSTEECRPFGFRWAHSEQDGASTKSACSTRRRAAGGSARAADTSHDVVDDDVADIAVDGMAGEATAAKEAVESAFDWPVGVLLAAISRVQELPRERMNVGVGHR